MIEINRQVAEVVMALTLKEQSMYWSAEISLAAGEVGFAAKTVS
ncbi:MAG: hypothetical protein AAGB10_14300 [Pseudomonadota bacterium]